MKMMKKNVLNIVLPITDNMRLASVYKVNVASAGRYPAEKFWGTKPHWVAVSLDRGPFGRCPATLSLKQAFYSR